MREVLAPSLAERTTLHLGGKALAELWPEDYDDLAQLSERAVRYGGPLYPWGRGSNMLPLDGEVPLVLVRLELFNELTVLEDDGDRVLLRVGAGVSLRRLLRHCQRQGLGGLEGLVGIPGSVGGAVAMNAGSFGSVIGDAIQSIKIWSPLGIQRVHASGLELGYRRMRVQGLTQPPIIVEVNLALTRKSKSVIFNSMVLNFIKKKSRQPLLAWSAGCAFKNPPSGPTAGQLLDMAGYRGRSLGGMAFSGQHANFLVNTGRGTSCQARELMDGARAAVKAQHGIELELEIRVVPCPWS